MTIALIEDSVSDRLVGALCNTLLHSLWQGILLAALAGLIVICTRATSSALRYKLLVSTLLLFAAGVSATFLWQYQKTGGVVVAQHIVQPSYTGNAVVIADHATPSIVAVRTSLTDRVNSYLNDHHNTIVLVWFLIICARSMQLCVGLYGTYRLKRVHVFRVMDYWSERMQQLADALGIKQTITLLESGLAKVPMVIGHLKPVVLVPIGLLTALSTEEVEAILVHELAHIKRCDYLVNMLQCLMEIVFFFNPAVLWVSTLIKTERENCCDDLALAQNNNKVNYIRALVSCEEYQSSVPAYAMAFPGSKNTLLDRVKRLVSDRNYSLNLVEKTVLAVCLVAMGLGVSAFTAREHIQKALKSVVAAIHHENKIQDKSKIDAVKSDTIKKKQVAPANANELLNKVQQLHPDTLKTTGSSALDALVHNVDSLKGTRKLNSPLALLAKLDTNNQTSKTFRAIGRELYREHVIVDTNHLNISLNELELIVNGVRMPEDMHARIYRQFGSKRERNNYNNGYSYNYLPSDGPEPTGAIIPDFGDTLVKYGVIKDKRHIHATFTRHRLIINGVKQPDEVCQMLLKKYGDNVNINYTNNGLPDTQMERQAYWAGRQRKMIDQMQREGLITDRNDISFTLTTKTFVVNGLVENGEVFERYRREYVPADAGDNWNWNYNSTPGDYRAYANSYRNSGARYQISAADRQRVEAERDKELVADLLQDGLIADPNNVTFTLSNKKLEINGKKQSVELYQKYKEKYVPNDSAGDWSWTYSHHK